MSIVNINGAIISESVVVKLKELQEQELGITIIEFVSKINRYLVQTADSYLDESKMAEILKMQTHLYCIEDVIIGLTKIEEEEE
jgi:hypothetical protein